MFHNSKFIFNKLIQIDKKFMLVNLSIEPSPINSFDTIADVIQIDGKFIAGS